jgi:hypothetical protein
VETPLDYSGLAVVVVDLLIILLPVLLNRVKVVAMVVHMLVVVMVDTIHKCQVKLER